MNFKQFLNSVTNKKADRDKTMRKINYSPSGVCSQQIDIELQGDTLKQVEFKGGCQGNTQGVARLAEGMKIDDIIEQLQGIDCKGRGTSCPDKLSRALSEIQRKEK